MQQTRQVAKHRVWIAAILAVSLLALPNSGYAAGRVRDFEELVEADFALQNKVRHRPAPDDAPLTAELDAMGGCDGHKDGKWGFHTNLAEKPWWQVDLGAVRRVGRVLIWNRCDGTAGRTAHLMLRFSQDGTAWRTVYTHNGTVFHGVTDDKPLTISLEDESTRYVRIELPGKDYLHLDEVEVFRSEKSHRNLAEGKPATQVGISKWSIRPVPVRQRGLAKLSPGETRARWKARRELLENPLLDFDALLFTKRVPGSFNHMSDQYFGWWSRPGGGIYILRDFTKGAPKETCITEHFTEPGSFLRPDLSYDGKKVLFAWCRHYPDLAAEPNKLDKANVPEDSFYHLFEMNLDGSDLRQITHGKYNDFDGRYLPDGSIVFLSTRRGHALQVGPRSIGETLAKADLPEAYVRCGGGPERPCAVYTLHTINPDGSDLRAISPFEMFEWTPAVAHDGTIVYSRWDYVDRDNMPYMSLWSMHPDGTHSRLVYGNFTKSPHCTFEPRSIPGSNKMILTASGHHAQTMGSLVMLDTTADTEGLVPVRRLTPEVAFPEIEGWPESYFANPWPLSERLHLVAWGCERSPNQGTSRSKNAMGIYLFDTSGQLELIYRDPSISSMYPIPIRPRKRPPILASTLAQNEDKEGSFLVLDVYRGLDTLRPGDVKALRIVAVPPKTHPTMNLPNLGITNDDPGKCVLGTVPVEEDGSAHFLAPPGVTLFFQALDAQGMAIQTMRSATHVQPGQSLTCIGCHESRHQAPPSKLTLAAARPPSKICPGPEGSWPLRFDQLVQPVLDRKCVGCHNPDGKHQKAAAFDLRAGTAYTSLTQYGTPSLHEHVWAGYRKGASSQGACAARQSALLAKLMEPKGHHKVVLDAEDLERFVTWMDTYAQRLGSFGEAQEQDLRVLRTRWESLLAPRAAGRVAAVSEDR